METTRTRRAALAALTLAAVALASAEARAGGYVAADFDIGGPMDASGARYALGIGGRAGWRFDLGPVWIGPELGSSYLAYWGASDDAFMTTNGALPHAARILAGMRFGLGGRVQPAFYGHAGAGWLGAHEVGPAFDAGLALDFALVPHFVFGAQLGYNVVAVWRGRTGMMGPVEIIETPAVARWVSTGLHAGVAF